MKFHQSSALSAVVTMTQVHTDPLINDCNENMQVLGKIEVQKQLRCNDSVRV